MGHRPLVPRTGSRHHRDPFRTRGGSHSNASRVTVTTFPRPSGLSPGAAASGCIMPGTRCVRAFQLRARSHPGALPWPDAPCVTRVCGPAGLPSRIHSQRSRSPSRFCLGSRSSLFWRPQTEALLQFSKLRRALKLPKCRLTRQPLEARQRGRHS